MLIPTGFTSFLVFSVVLLSLFMKISQCVYLREIHGPKIDAVRGSALENCVARNSIFALIFKCYRCVIFGDAQI
jgi:hypothetical protein